MHEIAARLAALDAKITHAYIEDGDVDELLDERMELYWCVELARLTVMRKA